jgi:hypothetical protein
MRTLSATCVAIALANREGHLRLVERESRFGGTFISLEDRFGVIEVADDMAAAQARVAEVAQ